MKRITYIDIIKFFGIFFLLFEHTGNFHALDGDYLYVKTWICSFHMPLFFIAYGMTYTKEKNYGSKLGIKSFLSFVDKRFLSLVIPYFIWCLIFSNGFDYRFFLGVLFGTNISLLWAATNQILWFFPAYFMANIVFWIINEISRKIPAKITVDLISAIICGFLSVKLIDYRGVLGIWFGLDIALTGVIYVIIGKYFRRIIDILSEKNTVLFVVIFLICIPLGWWISQNNIPEGYSNCVFAWAIYGRSYLFALLSASISILGISSFSVIIGKSRILGWLGENSMLIMCVHPIIFQLTVKFCATQYSNGIVIALLNSIITVLICVPIILLVNRYCPILIGKQSSMTTKKK